MESNNSVNTKSITIKMLTLQKSCWRHAQSAVPYNLRIVNFT